MLGWLFNKKEENPDLSEVAVDMHSHLIPGIDDGVKTVEEAVNMVRKMQSLGFRRLITTPHIMWDMYKNTPDIILSGLETVKEACKKEGLSIQVDAAAEYFIDEHFVKLLQDGERMLTLPGNRLLVELPYSTPLLNTSETLFSIIGYGYTPVLAHPERYSYFHSDPAVYRKLRDQGCELQMNILSVTGNYGPGVQKTALWLLQEKLISLLGTDAHRMQHLEKIDQALSSKWLKGYRFQNSQLH